MCLFLLVQVEPKVVSVLGKWNRSTTLKNVLGELRKYGKDFQSKEHNNHYRKNLQGQFKSLSNGPSYFVFKSNLKEGIIQ